MKTQLVTARQNLFLVLLGIFLVVFTWVFLWPKVNQVFENKKALEDEKVRLEKLKTKLADLEGLNEFELTGRTEFVLQAVPSEKKFLEVLSNLSQVAQINGLSAETFQVVPGDLTVNKEDKLEFKISFLGSSANVADFLGEAAKVLPIVDIKEVKVNSQGEAAKTDLTLVSLFLPLPTSLGSLEEPIQKLTPDEEKTLTKLTESISSSVKDLIGESGPTGRNDPFKF